MEIIGLVFEMMASMLSWVPVIVLNWLLLRKARLPGWATLVPFYGQYVYAKMLNRMWYFWAQIICMAAVILSFIGFAVCTVIESDITAGIAILLMFMLFAVAITSIVIQILMNVQLAKVFGQSGWFAVGLVFLNLIFKLILVVDSSIKYVGDGSMPNLDYNPNYNPTNPQFNDDQYNNGYVQPNVANNMQSGGYQNPEYQTLDNENESKENENYQMPVDNQGQDN